jgi:hypothetical protein
LPHDGHVSRVAAEVGDVIAHPFERGHDVEHAHVARRRKFVAAGARQVAFWSRLTMSCC